MTSPIANKDVEFCEKRFFSVSSLKASSEQHTSKVLKSTNGEDDNIWKDRHRLKKGFQFACVKSDCNFVAPDILESQKHSTICEGIRRYDRRLTFFLLFTISL